MPGIAGLNPAESIEFRLLCLFCGLLRRPDLMFRRLTVFVCVFVYVCVCVSACVYVFVYVCFLCVSNCVLFRNLNNEAA
jgi:hypothetical protein